MPSRTGLIAATGAAALALLTTLTAPEASAASESCRDLDTPVTVAGQSLQVHAQRCDPADGTETVLVLVPGSTYDHSYWDFPYRPDTYSFRKAMNDAGYATVAVDRLGTGASSKPLSATVSATTQAEAVHQVISSLRDRGGPDDGYRKVVLGGHSLGSTITNIEASTYRDVDGVLLTGFTNNYNVPGVTNFFASLYPAAVDRQLTGRGLDPGYLTTRPGVRESAFFAPGPVDPAVIAADEEGKDVLSVVEAPDGATVGTVTTLSRNIDAPTMIANGQRDSVYCGSLGSVGGIDCQDAASLARDERPYFSPAAIPMSCGVRGTRSTWSRTPRTTRTPSSGGSTRRSPRADPTSPLALTLSCMTPAHDLVAVLRPTPGPRVLHRVRAAPGELARLQLRLRTPGRPRRRAPRNALGTEHDGSGRT